jgi:hypothetical protein
MWQHGFLGYDASLMLDVVVTALVLVVPVLAGGILLAKSGRYTQHKRLQLTLAVVLLLTVAAFEVDMQWVHGGWENVVNKDPAVPRLAGERLAVVRSILSVHLLFAVTTPLLWGVTIALALRRMPVPPTPCAHSSLHKLLGWAAAADLGLTSVTGLAFYYAAFVAPP